MLMVLGETASAVYAAAYSAYKAPADVLSANNLGAMLKGAQDYADAAIALQYARSLAPKSPLIAANLGWLAMNQGDSAAAAPYFKAAVGEAPQMAIALSGQGLIEACAGHVAKALPLFRASLAAGFSELAMDGVDITEQALDSSAKPGAKPDLSSPDVYGPKSSNVFDWPPPPLPPDAKTMADYSEVASDSNYSGIVQYNNAISKQGLQVAAIAQTLGDIGPHTRFDGRNIVFQRGYDKEDFVLSDLRTMLKSELQKPEDDESGDVDAFRNEDSCFTCSGDIQAPQPSCSNQTRLIAVYRKYYPRFNDEWNRLQQAIADLYGFSEPWLARIHDPATARAEKAALDSFVLEYVEAFDSSLVLVSMEAHSAWQSHPYQSCSDPSAGQPPLQKVKPYKIDPTKCQMKPTFYPMMFGSGNADCDQITLSMGLEGWGGSLQYQFPPDYVLQNGVYVSNTGADGEWTMFGGINLSTPSEIPIGAGAKVGEFASFQGGKLVDLGFQDEATAGLNVAGLNLSAGTTTRVGVVSGVNVTPTASGDGDWGSLPNE
ncbi:MAG: tetratricopeptide repeat protein [Gammaproteobacteria bacterium]